MKKSLKMLVIVLAIMMISSCAYLLGGGDNQDVAIVWSQTNSVHLI